MPKPYGFGHFVSDLARKTLSRQEAQEKLRQCASYEALRHSDVRDWVREHFRFEPQVEEVLKRHSPEVLKLTGLDALLDSFGQDWVTPLSSDDSALAETH